MAELVFGYFKEDTLLHRLDARIKLAALVLVSLTSMQAGYSALSLAFPFTLFLLAKARCPLLHCLCGLKWYYVLLACVVFTRSLTTPGDSLIDHAWFPASRQGFSAGLLLAGRLLLVALFGMLISFTTRPSHIRSAVEWYLRPIPFIPHQQVATMIGLMVRFIPVILAQSSELDEALRARAIDNRKNPLRRITYLCMPLLRRTFVTADRLASAMEARCYGSIKTTYQKKITIQDWSAFAVIAGLCALMLRIS